MPIPSDGWRISGPSGIDRKALIGKALAFLFGCAIGAAAMLWRLR